MRVLLIVLSLFSGAAAAQEYPAREIRAICNYAPGSGADIMVRFYAGQLSRLLDKPVIVENKPSANGLIANDFVAKEPDGYTILITPVSSTITSAPHLFKQVPFDSAKDFTPVTTIATLAFVISVEAARSARGPGRRAARLHRLRLHLVAAAAQRRAHPHPRDDLGEAPERAEGFSDPRQLVQPDHGRADENRRGALGALRQGREDRAAIIGA
jgi:hypothetical protein